MIELRCKQCRITYQAKPYRASTSIYCSRACYGLANKGKVPKSAFKPGQRVSPKTEFKKGGIPFSKLNPEAMPRGENHYAWKGDEVGYHALHSWIQRILGKPNVCQHCETVFLKGSKSLHWANKSGRYLRRLDDWLRLCVPCHKAYDTKRRKSVK